MAVFVGVMAEAKTMEVHWRPWRCIGGAGDRRHGRWSSAEISCLLDKGKRKRIGLLLEGLIAR